MISKPLLKQIIKSNYKLMLLFSGVLSVFLTVMTIVFTPSTIKGVENIAADSVIAQMFAGNNTLIGFMSNSFYVMMAIIFPMVYSIIVGNRLIAGQVDRGSMAYLLSTPTKRNKITITSALYFICSLAFMWIIASIVGIVAGEIFQPDALDVEKFLMLNMGCFLYHFAISSICFSSSCIFNLSKNSLAIGAGVPLGFFVINLMATLSDELSFLKYFTLNTLFDTKSIMSKEGYGIDFIVLTIIGIVLYMVGIKVFKEKDLPL
ncbi:ABC transporter permease subunit [Clostridium gasigenes]|uniref:ABC-2 type transport system permease protein n=1 Tax=Clostridium gasigenes TaxID=94869 RepID=A0A1H0S675_9CLOT|nr:ABC transporter permease subunit [Clostridium gasigenes]MBB6622725.1 ABC transporter permease subunit [Clostridium gasigenes]MBU3089517.1 ABC transporter permease [Clostridium gasigenes]SDP36726.1 ABC-2 type transport system permease protein [Clostridium gasigenes]